MLGWIVPAANQAFRLSVAGRPVMKGINELTLRELGQLLEPGTHEPMAVAPPSDWYRLALNYHTRWALSCAPIVLSLFAVAVTSRGRHGRLMLGFAGCGAILGYCVLMLRRAGSDSTAQYLRTPPRGFRTQPSWLYQQH